MCAEVLLQIPDSIIYDTDGQIFNRWILRNYMIMKHVMVVRCMLHYSSRQSSSGRKPPQILTTTM